MQTASDARLAQSAYLTLIGILGRSLSRYHVPGGEWQLVEQLVPAPVAAPIYTPTSHAHLATSQVDAAKDRELFACGVLHDTTQLQLRPDRIQKFIEKCCQVPAPLWPEVKELLGLLDLPSLSKEVYQIGAVHPETMKLALSGKLASAMRAFPARACVGPDGVERSPEMIRDIITEIARYHILISLVQAGRAAYARCFLPTGMSVLDKQLGPRATQVKHVAGTIAWNACWMRPIMALYIVTKSRPATEAEQEMIKAEPGLLEEGLRWQQELTRIHGADTAAVVDRMHRWAAVWAARIHKAAVREHAEAGANTTMYARQGTQPLARLWLTCSMAAAWLADGVNSELHAALKNIRSGKPVQKPKMRIKTDVATRELFFLIRNCIARDPKAPAVQEARKTGDLFDAVLRLSQNESSKKLLDDRFRSTMKAEGNKAFKEAIARNDRVFLAEVDGLIWRQLHL